MTVLDRKPRRLDNALTVLATKRMGVEVSDKMSDRYVYNVREAADLMDCHIDTVRRLIRRGRIRAHLLGGSQKAGYRINGGEIRRLLTGRTS